MYLHKEIELMELKILFYIKFYRYISCKNAKTGFAFI